MRFGKVCLALILCLAGVASAATWTSPDRMVSFDVPTTAGLIPIKDPPAPAIALWEAIDGQSRLVFVISPNPKNTPIDKAGLEEGTVTQFPGGSIVSSTVTTISGVHVYTIAATNSTKDAYLQQSIANFNGSVYKLMAAGPKPIASDPRLNGSFASFNILDPNAKEPGGMSMHDWSKSLGGIGLAVLVVGGIFAMSRRAMKPKRPPQGQ